MTRKEKNTNKIALVGNRGVGKSSIGKLLSFYLNYNYIPMDMLVRYQNSGRNIQNIIQDFGWGKFREIEEEVLGKLIYFENVVIDCGGGIITEVDPTANDGKEIFSVSKANLLENFYVVYIHASMDWLLSHQKIDADRPQYNTSVKNIIQDREKWYYKISNYTIDRTDIDTTIAAIRLYQHIMQKL